MEDTQNKLIRRLKGKTGWDYAHKLMQDFETRWNLSFDDAEFPMPHYTEKMINFCERRFQRILTVAEVKQPT